MSWPFGPRRSLLTNALRNARPATWPGASEGGLSTAELDEDKVPETARPSAGRPDQGDSAALSAGGNAGESSGTGRAGLSVATARDRGDDDARVLSPLSPFFPTHGPTSIQLPPKQPTASGSKLKTSPPRPKAADFLLPIDSPAIALTPQSLIPPKLPAAEVPAGKKRTPTGPKGWADPQGGDGSSVGGGEKPKEDWTREDWEKQRVEENEREKKRARTERFEKERKYLGERAGGQRSAVGSPAGGPGMSAWASLDARDRRQGKEMRPGPAPVRDQGYKKRRDGLEKDRRAEQNREDERSKTCDMDASSSSSSSRANERRRSRSPSPRPRRSPPQVDANFPPPRAGPSVSIPSETLDTITELARLAQLHHQQTTTANQLSRSASTPSYLNGPVSAPPSRTSPSPPPPPSVFPQLTQQWNTVQPLLSDLVPRPSTEPSFVKLKSDNAARRAKLVALGRSLDGEEEESDRRREIKRPYLPELESDVANEEEDWRAILRESEDRLAKLEEARAAPQEITSDTLPLTTLTPAILAHIATLLPPPPPPPPKPIIIHPPPADFADQIRRLASNTDAILQHLQRQLEGVEKGWERVEKALGRS